MGILGKEKMLFKSKDRIRLISVEEAFELQEHRGYRPQILSQGMWRNCHIFYIGKQTPCKIQYRLPVVLDNKRYNLDKTLCVTEDTKFATDYGDVKAPNLSKTINITCPANAYPVVVSDKNNGNNTFKLGVITGLFVHLGTEYYDPKQGLSYRIMVKEEELQSCLEDIELAFKYYQPGKKIFDEIETHESPLKGHYIVKITHPDICSFIKSIRISEDGDFDTSIILRGSSFIYGFFKGWVGYSSSKIDVVDKRVMNKIRTIMMYLGYELLNIDSENYLCKVTQKTSIPSVISVNKLEEEADFYGISVEDQLYPYYDFYGKFIIKNSMSWN